MRKERALRVSWLLCLLVVGDVGRAKGPAVEFPGFLDLCSVVVQVRVVWLDQNTGSAFVAITRTLRGGALNGQSLRVWPSAGCREHLLSLLSKDKLALLGLDHDMVVLFVGAVSTDASREVTIRVPHYAPLRHSAYPENGALFRCASDRRSVVVALGDLESILADPIQMSARTTEPLVHVGSAPRSGTPMLSVAMRTAADTAVTIELGTRDQPLVLGSLRLQFLVGKSVPAYRNDAMPDDVAQGQRSVLISVQGSYSPDDLLRAVKGDPSFELFPVGGGRHLEPQVFEQPIPLAAVLDGVLEETTGPTPGALVLLPGKSIEFRVPITEALRDLDRHVAVSPLVRASLVIRPVPWRIERQEHLRGEVSSTPVVFGVVR